jgi:hypothetical protein
MNAFSLFVRSLLALLLMVCATSGIVSAAPTVPTVVPTLKLQLAHWVDNGDGTVSDNVTGLMWEKKSPAGTGGLHDVSTIYSWSLGATDGRPDGTLFVTFLRWLNGGDFYVAADGMIESAGALSCFANHCDWRLPTIAELSTIIELAAAGCKRGSPCIDVVFGPTQGLYTSASTVVFNPTWAWAVDFDQGVVCVGANGSCSAKSMLYHARAVRG